MCTLSGEARPSFSDGALENRDDKERIHFSGKTYEGLLYSIKVKTISELFHCSES